VNVHGQRTTALGCDLEVVEPRGDAFVADYLTAAERALVERAGPADRALAVALVWSAKESALKALRTGLRLDTRDVAVEPAGPLPGEPIPAGRWWPLAVRHPAGGRVFAGWWRRDADRVATVVAAPAPTARNASPPTHDARGRGQDVRPQPRCCHPQEGR
jgi:4'-phosphopantetheinyl transferase